MDDIPLSAQLTALGILLLASAFFSLAETSMMALNRYRLKALVRLGSRGAKLTTDLLAHTDRLLGVILLGNTLVAAGAATLTAVITKRLYGEGELPLALGTLAITFALLVFSEIAPKVEQLFVYQRSPNWVLPKGDTAFTTEQLAEFAAD